MHHFLTSLLNIAIYYYFSSTSPQQGTQEQNGNFNEKALLVTNLFGTTLLLHGFGLCGRAVLVSPAYINRIVTPQPTVPREHIGAQHT